MTRFRTARILLTGFWNHSGRRGVLIPILAILLLSMSGQAAAADALIFFKNYFITGDYVVGGVGLRGTGVNGFATGTINMTNAAVPPGAEILGAFLYWETV